jgi:hypothetical protein
MPHAPMGIMTSPAFDLQVHLAFKEPWQILSMKNIGLVNVGVSPIAVTQPFQLFSPEAIKIMRMEIENPEIKENCGFTSNIANAQLRGYARRYAPFIFAAWKHSEVIAIVSKLAGIDVVPWGDYEVAHINLSAVKTEEEANAELSALHARRSSIQQQTTNLLSAGTLTHTRSIGRQAGQQFDTLG